MLSSIWHKFIRGISNLGNHEALGKLGDFTTTPRTVIISLLAIIIGLISAFVALILLRLIGFFTNLFFFQRWGTVLVSPADNHLGFFEIFVPVIGALIIGLIARYGSERIRGHGIPEAIESILINGSRVEPKVAFWKPLSSALSIGTGGPFGAEGPIIMTGGAFGSLIAQFFHLSSTERKTLLVAGAAGGMSATFVSPIAAVLLAVELLLFEWKPRSLIPVALASATAVATRRFIIGMGPLFPTPPHPAFIGPGGLLGCVVVGLLAGALSALLTVAVYAAEDAFRLLPIHWMWWPAIGGLVVGIGGLIFPQALGVGYDIIGTLLAGKGTIELILGILIVKSIIWSVSLGSGTSGGVLAPLLMMGGALGGLEAFFLPNEGLGFWPLVSMGAILGGTLRSPFTGIVFALEVTHDVNMLLPLLIAVVIAHGFTVLVMRRSILTEKVSRRGYHLTQEYATDPLEIIFVREVMRTNVVALSDKISLQDLVKLLTRNPIPAPVSANGGAGVTQEKVASLAPASPINADKETRSAASHRIQHLYPVLDAKEHLIGVMTRRDVQELVYDINDGMNGKSNGSGYILADLVNRHPVVAYADEPLRVAVYRMADTGFTRLPVVERDDPRKLAGIVSLSDLLKARARSLEKERRRERVLCLRLLFPAHNVKKTERVE